MKIKITLFALLLSLISFGQDREYETANSYYKNQNYNEAITIGEKILLNQYGSVSPLLKLYTMFLVADSYKLLNKYPEAIKRYKEYLELIKSSSLFNDKIKEKATIDIQKGIDEMQSKIVLTEKTNSGTSTKQIETEIFSTENKITKNDTSENSVAKITDMDKSVTLTVSSSGKTIEEAKNNALRSAIEQAFGTFISSKTELLNDNIVKDEIVSVANGNIKNYEIVSQVEIPGNGFGVTIKATVSIDKLTSFAESKGIEIEFKGGLFAQNIKLQKINEQNELTASLNIYSIVDELLQNGFDYSLETEDPKLVKDDLYSIKFIVKVKPNTNYINAIEYLNNSLDKLAMSPDEIATYVKLNKEIYKFREYYLRNQLSDETISHLMNYGYYLGNFQITINDNDVIYGPDQGFELSQQLLFSSLGKEIPTPSYTYWHYYEYCPGDDMGDAFLSLSSNSEIKTDQCWVPYYVKNDSNFVYVWEQQFKLSDIEKMQKINITSRGVRSKFKYGGYVIYDDGEKIIVAAPYDLRYSVDDTRSPEANALNVSVKTSGEIFDGKKNMDLLKNSTYSELISNFNNKNNTDWHIATANELKLYMKEVGSLQGIPYLSSTFFPDNWGNFLFQWDLDSVENKIEINEKAKIYFQDGRPFNSCEAFETIKGFTKRDIDQMLYRGYSFNLPLVKYVLIK